MGGIPAAEVTFRTPAAAKSIEKIAAALPEMFVCAGTVLSVEQAKLAVDCGAKAVISPGTNRDGGGMVPEEPGARVPRLRHPRGGSRPGPGPHHGEALPRRSGGGVKMLKALYGPYRGVVHAYRRHQPQQCEGLPLPAQRHRLRRQLALPAGDINEGSWAAITSGPASAWLWCRKCGQASDQKYAKKGAETAPFFLCSSAHRANGSNAWTSRPFTKSSAS